nr:ulp1 protease family, C-terminal catalytic domain-containing protein [Tanacetum cinerariifolium]
MRDLLIQHGCKATLEVLPADMNAQTEAELNKKAHSAMILCLGNKVLREVVRETIAAGVWSKLETLECKIRGIGKVRVQVRNGSSFVLHNVRVVLYGIRRDNCVYSLDGHAVAGDGKAGAVWQKEFRRVWVYILRFKHELFGKFKEWKQLVENQTERTVKKLRTDNSIEFCNREFEQLYVESEIARRLIVSGTSQQNGLAERMNRTLRDKVCCLLISVDCPRPSGWKRHVRKLEPKAVKCVLLGYPEGVKGYRLYTIDDELPKTVTIGNVVFNKSVMYKETLKDSGTGADKSVEELQVEVKLQGLKKRTLEEDQTDPENGDDEDAGDQETDQTPDLTDYQLVRDREPRTRTKPSRFRDKSNMVAYAFVIAEEEDTRESLTCQEAVAYEDSSKWKAAIKEETNSLMKNKTWELVDHPAGQNLVRCKWLFKIKEGIEHVQKPSCWFMFRVVLDSETEEASVSRSFFLPSWLVMHRLSKGAPEQCYMMVFRLNVQFNGAKVLEREHTTLSNGLKYYDLKVGKELELMNYNELLKVTLGDKETSQVEKENVVNIMSLQALKDEVLLNRPHSVIDGYNKWIIRGDYAEPYAISVNKKVFRQSNESYFAINATDIIELLTYQELDCGIMTLFEMSLCHLKGHSSQNKVGFLNPGMIIADSCFYEKWVIIDYLTQSLTGYEFYLAPYLQGRHCVLFIICPKHGMGFFLNSSNGSNTNEQCYRLAGLVESVVGSLKWEFPLVNRQSGDWECRYYVMKWMYDFKLPKETIAVESNSSRIRFSMRYQVVLDDMPIACKSKDGVGSTKSLIKKEFDIKELEKAKKILGMEIVRDRSRKSLRVSQSGYISKILNNFRIDNRKSVKMPLGGNFNMTLKDCPVRDCDVERMSKVPYTNAAGSLMYLMVCTRPDIAYAKFYKAKKRLFYVKRNKAISLGNITSKVGIEVDQLSLRDCTDLTSLSLDELTGNLIVHEMIIKKDFEIVKAKGKRNSLALKAKKESSDEECSTFKNMPWSRLGVDLELDEWIKDNGCSKHMTGNRKLFSSYKAYNRGNVIFGSNLCGNIIGKGTISNDSLKIDNVEHVDNLRFNLLSIGQRCDNKCTVTFSEHDSKITKDGKVIGRGIRKKCLYVMKLGNKPKDQICLATIDENSTLWHRRLGHTNVRLIQALASKELVRNLPKLKFDQHFGDACKIGKQAHASHKAKNIVSTTRCLELLHMDLLGLSAVRSYEENRYTLVIVDDYSRSCPNEAKARTIELKPDICSEDEKGKDY